MRNSLLTLIFALILSVSGYSQYNIDYGFSVGASNYLGEFGGGEGQGRAFVTDLEFSYTRWTLGGFFRYKLSPKIATKISLNYIRLSGDDKKSDNYTRKARNLNFKNDMFEFSAALEYYIYKANDVGGSGRYNTDFNLYVFAGVGAFYSAPKGQRVSGEWVSLKFEATEGVSYSSINLAIPVGIGFYYTLQRKYRVGLEIGWRTTFTDYIDDASSNYVNGYDGLSNKTSPEILAEVNASSGEEQVLTSNHYTTGSVRGNSENNDSYMTATFNLSWAIRGKSRFYRSSHSWVLGKKKRRRRKSRAKF